MGELLIVGLATDGPSYQVFRPKDETELVSLYGGNYTEQFTVPGTGTFVDLTYTPWARQTQNIVDGVRDYLFSPVVSGATLLSNPIGAVSGNPLLVFGSTGSPTGSTIQVRYTPYLGGSDLICAGRSYLATTGKTPYVCRVGGHYAYAAASGWLLTSKYAGARYRDLTATITPTSLTVGGMEPNYATLTYTGATPYDIWVQVETDYSLGVSPFKILRYPGVGISVPSLPFNNGDDGVLDETVFSTFVDSLEAPLNITHVLVLTPCSSGFVNAIYDLYSDTDNQVRVFIMPAPTFPGDTGTYIDSIRTSLPDRSNMLGLVLGTGDVDIAGTRINRYLAEGAAFALVNSASFNLTNLKINAVNFSPLLAKSSLDQLVGAGIMPPTRFIENDISVYQGVMSDGVNTPPLSNIYAEIYSRSFAVVYNYYGNILNPGKQQGIESAITLALNGIPFLSNTTCLANYASGELDINISTEYFDEILSIGFGINNS